MVEQGVDQLRGLARGAAEHGLEGVQVCAAPEHRQGRQGPLLGGVEQRPRPRHGVQQRGPAGLGVPIAQPLRGLVEPLEERLGGQEGGAGRGELEGERQRIECVYDGVEDRRVGLRPPAPGLAPRAVEEHRAGGPCLQAIEGEHQLHGGAQAVAARGEHAQIGGELERDLQERDHLLAQVLGVVEHQEADALVGQAAPERGVGGLERGDQERPRDRGLQPARGCRDEVDPHGGGTVGGHQRAGEGGLAHAARPVQGDQPARAELATEALQRRIATEQPGRGGGQRGGGGARVGGQLEAVALAPYGLDQRGRLRVGLDLLAQPPDGDVDGARGHARRVAPHVHEELGAAHGLSVAAQEPGEQGSLALGEDLGLALAEHRPGAQIDGDGADAERLPGLREVGDERANHRLVVALVHQLEHVPGTSEHVAPCLDPHLVPEDDGVGPQVVADVCGPVADGDGEPGLAEPLQQGGLGLRIPRDGEHDQHLRSLTPVLRRRRHRNRQRRAAPSWMRRA